MKQKMIGVVEIVQKDGTIAYVSPARARRIAEALMKLAQIAEDEDKRTGVFVGDATARKSRR